MSILPKYFFVNSEWSLHLTFLVSILCLSSVIRAFDGDACNLTRIRKMESISNRRINRLDSTATDDEGYDNFVFSL